MHGRYGTDILKMCMKKFNAEIFFLTNLQGFVLHIAGGVYCKLCLQPISCFDQILISYTFQHCLATGMQNGDEALSKNSTACPARSPRENLCTG